MSDLNFEFIGWCRDLKENHDKVWGVISLDDNWFSGRVLVFWGRRGKKLQTKFDNCGVALDKLIRTKIKGGYTEISPTKLHTVYPEFNSDLEKTAMWAILEI